MASSLESFQQSVITRFLAAPAGRVAVGFADYLDLPPNVRSGDEMNVVDHRFSVPMLDWLGFGAAPFSVQHNVNHTTGTPDHVVELNGQPVLVWEDKNTTEEFTPAWEAQLARYAVGRTRYAVWTNARRVLVFNVDPSGELTKLVDFDVEATFGRNPSREILDEAQTQIALLELVIGGRRFRDFETVANSIGIDEATFVATAQPLIGGNALQAFMDGARSVLESLRLAALAALGEAERDQAAIEQQRESALQAWDAVRSRYEASFFDGPPAEVHETLREIRSQLGSSRDARIRDLVGKLPDKGAVALAAVQAFTGPTLQTNAALSVRQLSQRASRTVLDAYHVWMEQQHEVENAAKEIFAQQVAYVFFVRLFLVRILEDKSIVVPRIASDGGFQRWKDVVVSDSLFSGPYLSLISARVSNHYHHFFHQPVFDWFVPDDFVFLETLAFLTRWNLAEIDSDALGFTYERYLEKVVNKKKGHFLTRPETVEYILDEAGYSGRQIIGRLVIDPACGSGSFLVHAIRRYRRALQESFTGADGKVRELELADRFVRDVSELFVGLEIEPFSAYLAELNLLIQISSDLQLLRSSGRSAPIDRFQIYRTDSLDLPPFILQGQEFGGIDADAAEVDEGYLVKSRQGPFAGGFGYVISNPPYINPRQHFGAARHRRAPFFAAYLDGDANTYAMFLRLGVFLLGDGGTLAMIVPLTLIGDQQASKVRELLCTLPIGVRAVTRFYKGNVLFPGVDQATCVIVAGVPRPLIETAGGVDLADVRTERYRVRSRRVVDAAPRGSPWGRPFLVGTRAEEYAVWSQVRQRWLDRPSISRELTAALDVKQGDANATHLNPCRTGTSGNGAIPVFKGEDVFRYAPLPTTPSDWVVPNRRDALSSAQENARLSVERLVALNATEQGIALRQVARLDTRRRLIGTWFERTPERTFVLTNELWRMVVRQGESSRALAALGFLNSALAAYIYNLFSTNNHVSTTELFRMPAPSLARLAQAGAPLAVQSALESRADYEARFVRDTGARDAEGVVAVDAATLLGNLGLPMLTLGDYVRRGEVTITNSARRIRSLLASGGIVFSDISLNGLAPRLLAEHIDRRMDQVVESTKLPDPVAVGRFAQELRDSDTAAQAGYDRCRRDEEQIDELVFDWYKLRPSLRDSVRAGIRWAGG